MARNVYHVTYRSTDSKWQVKKTGNDQASSVHYTKEAAIDAGKSLAKANEPSQLVIHKMDGIFETEYTYGNDPYPPKG